MSLTRRQLLKVAGTGAAVGLAGCSGSGKTPEPGVQAEAAANLQMSQNGAPVLVVQWLVNRDARYLSVDVENVTTGESVSTAMCGLGSTLQYNGATGNVNSQGPVGNAPNCEKGTPSGLTFGPSDTLDVTVTAHLPGDETEVIVSQEYTVTTPTPPPTTAGNSSSNG